MGDVNKQKIQLRPGLSINGDKTPSPVTKLLISHGKPNFTIQRSPKAQNGNANPLSPPPVDVKANNNNNEFVVKSTTFNGIFKPSNISTVAKQTLQQNAHINSSNGEDNEAAKVVLRRTKVVQTEVRENNDAEHVPEFIRRQRRIQERLANQNILDFENRRSGYFTQVMISPSSPNRQSFVETMARPAVKPGLELPAPTPPEDIKEEMLQEQTADVETNVEPVVQAESITHYGHDEEEVAKAIEEVNKAVEGEDDDKNVVEEHTENLLENTKQNLQPTVAAVANLDHVEQTTLAEEKQEENLPVATVVTSAVVAEEPFKEEDKSLVTEIITSALEVAEEVPAVQQNGYVEVLATSNEMEESKSNGFVESEDHQNGEITISHTNCLKGPSLPSPDPKGEKGVNFESKTVVSFSQELGNDVNKYPDTVKVIKDVENLDVDNDLKELTKLKFEIKADDKDIKIKPILINETA